jgi:hypothetical protein
MLDHGRIISRLRLVRTVQSGGLIQRDEDYSLLGLA